MQGNVGTGTGEPSWSGVVVVSDHGLESLLTARKTPETTVADSKPSRVLIGFARENLR
jgi:hypothetical protein